jgi:hypothetical protein
MPPGSATADQVLAFHRWAEQEVAGRTVAADLLVESVSAAGTSGAVVTGTLLNLPDVNGRVAHCRVRAEFADVGHDVTGLPPKGLVTVVGEMARRTPLYPSQGTAAVGGGEGRVTGWSDRHAFFGANVVECRLGGGGRARAAPAASAAEGPKPAPPDSPPPPAEAKPPAPAPKAEAAAVLPPPPPPAPAKPPQGPPAGSTTFFGVPSADAARIVYIGDRSGSMTDSFDYLQAELKRSIRQLSAARFFTVMFFSSGPPTEMPGRELVRADDEGKSKAFQFIHATVPHGQTDPSEAFKRAFALKPDLIYFLTDGEFDPVVVGLVKGLNADGKVRVSTVAFLYDTGEKVLKEIAAENGGTYTFIREKDLAPSAKDPPPPSPPHLP